MEDLVFFFSSRRRHTRFDCDWSSDVCSSDLYVCVAIALVLGAPLFIYFGSLSDRIGRKKIMMAGNLLAAILYVPIYHAMKFYSSPVNAVALTALVFVQVVFVTMVYGPIAAFLVEAFPDRKSVV